MYKGFALNWVVTNDGRGAYFGARDLDALRALGADIVRFELRLGAVPGWTDEILNQYRGVARQLTGAGIAPIGLIAADAVNGARQADWNANNAETTPGSGDNPFCQRFAEAARQLATALPEIALWEIWNEPNVWHQHDGATYSGGSFIYPSNYAALLTRASAAIKGAQPRSTIISGGLLGHNNHGALTAQNSGAPYLESLYQALQRVGSGEVPFDAVGYHPYLDQPGHANAGHLRQYLGYMRDVVARHERGRDRPIYVTEVGWSTRSVAPDVHASNLRTVLQTCAGDGHVAAVCWFQVRDNPSANLFFGVCAQDWTHKPAFAAFQRVAT